jgi:F0F1-type ATP synthase membrane subunit c/vacuolar-type H+-ATPase subunit K
MNLEKSTLHGTEIVNCFLAKYLMVGGATLDAAVLSGITYAPGLKMSAKDVKYLNGSGEFGW